MKSLSSITRLPILAAALVAGSLYRNPVVDTAADVTVSFSIHEMFGLANVACLVSASKWSTLLPA